MNVLILDVGTSSMRGTLMDERGRALAQKQIKYQPEFQPGGRVEQDADQWRRALLAIAAELGKRGGIAAIGLTAQRSSLIPVDEQGTPLRRAVMWQDTRNAEIADRLSAHNDRVFAATGSRVNTVYSGTKMAWLRQAEPETYAAADKLAVVADYLVGVMTGRVRTDATYGSRSLLMDLRTRQWDSELLALFGVEREKLCEIVAPGGVIGTTCAAFAAETGLPPGLPVVSCGGDQQCGALGQGVLRDGDLSVNLGTGAYLIAASRGVPEGLKQDVVCNASAVPGEYILESNLLSCCCALDWFMAQFCPDLSYDALNGVLDRTVPGAGGVLCLPDFQGRSMPDWNSRARGVFSGLSLSSTREDCLRALLEGICYEISAHIGCMSAYVPVEHLSCAGGLTRCGGFVQLLSDVTGRAVTVRPDAEATTLGAWMSTVCALGLYSDLSLTWEAVCPKEETRYQPNPARTAFYRAQQRAQASLYHRVNP